MIDAVEAAHDIDSNRIYAAGHSGGGAQVSLMLALWPDVFAGGGIFAGIPFHCTTEYNQVSSCLSPGIDKTPEQHAQFVLDAYPGFNGTYPKLSIWHGTSDFFVQPMNQTELLEQWSTVHGIDMTPDVTETIGSGERSEFHDANGNALIETWTITGGGHATFVSPSEGCGSAGLYFEDQGLCGARYMAEFWALGDPSGGGTGGDTDTGESGDTGDSSGGSGASGGGSSASGGDDGGSETTGDETTGDDSGDGDDSGTGGEPGQDDADGEGENKGVGLCRVAPGNGDGAPLMIFLGFALAYARRRPPR